MHRAVMHAAGDDVKELPLTGECVDVQLWLPCAVHGQGEAHVLDM